VTPPAIAAGTFDGIGSGPTYVQESFGFGQGSRLKQNGSATAIVLHDNINGIRAEFPNNSTETWIAPPEVAGGQEWDFSVTSSADEYQPVTPLEVNEFGPINGTLSLNGTDFLSGGPDLRPNALLPFAAPTNSASTVSVDELPLFSKVAVGFTSASTLNGNFEKSGQAWLEVNTMENAPAGGGTFIDTWTFHAGGSSVSGTFGVPTTVFNRLEVSYDPVAHVAAASLNGQVVAEVPYTATAAIKYAGIEGSSVATVDNFGLRKGSVTDGAAGASAPIAAAAKTASLFSSTPVSSASAASVLDLTAGRLSV
jgi:hypothetical protein